MTSAKKSWNSGVISSCQYLQENFDVMKPLNLVANKASEMFNSVVDAESTPTESHEDVQSSTDSSSDDKS